jgi:alanyl-tRNA synthetase
MTLFILKNQEKLPPTEKVFIDNPYQTECEATVLYTQDDLLVLDKTVFYPESGGQVSDKGLINGIQVKDVQKQPGKVVFINRPGIEVPMVHTNTVVVHQLEQPSSFTVGQIVHLKIDWSYRYLLMRYHSATHFVFHALNQIYGQKEKLYIKGCYIYQESARLDYANKFNPDLIIDVLSLTNDLISQGDEIIMEPDLSTKDISYWRYKNIIIPCGGTHVKSAQEIGIVTVRRKSHGKNLDRIYVSIQE